MKKILSYPSMLSSVLALALLLPQVGAACQSLCLRNSTAKYFGKNYVWPYDHGRLFVNRKNLKKRALVKPGSQAATWTSKYSSLTFNQVAEHFPIGGINSEGLALEVLVHFGAEFPTESQQGTVNELQWIQYLLDTSATIDEAIAAAKRVTIVPLSEEGLHYHACDKSGACAVFEYKKEELVVVKDAPTLTNMSIEDGSMIREEMDDLVTAFAKQTFKTHSEEVKGVFDLLKEVTSFSAWKLVYELNNGVVHFKIRRDADPRTVAFSTFTDAADLDCQADKGALKKDAKLAPSLRWNLLAGGKKAGATLTAADFSREAGDNKLLVTQGTKMLRRVQTQRGLVEALQSYHEHYISCVPRKEAEKKP